MVQDTLARLSRDGLIEEVASTSRRRPYRITADGLVELDTALAMTTRLVQAGRQVLRE
jgi:DNA-binding PadR family transcriptional regulator